MSTASSASDRIEQAHAALESYEKARRQHVRFGEQYGILAGAAGPLAVALRSMIEPAAIDETPERMADAWQQQLIERGLVATFGFDRVAEPRNDYPLHRDAYLFGIRAGITAAWNSWEPETAPGLPSGTLEQLIAEAEGALAEYRETFDTYSAANGDTGEASMRDYEEYEDAIMDTHMPNVAAVLTSLIAALKDQS